MTALSIIIPVYNGALYLPDCLNGLLAQKLDSEGDIEIICVNDGSKDESLVILQEYASKDARIKIIDQENAGAGAARNAGLDIAKGEYLFFFDGDDILESHALQSLYKAARLSDADIVTCRSNCRIEPEGHTFLSEASPDYDVLKPVAKREHDGMLSMYPMQSPRHIMRTFVAWPWDKLIRKEFILRHGLRYQCLRHSNDAYFIFMALMLANKIVVVETALITHRSYSNSLSATRAKAPDCFYRACIAIHESLKAKGIEEIYRQSFINFCIDFSLWHINTVGQLEAQQIMIQKAGELFEMLDVPSLPKSYFDERRLYVLANEIIALSHAAPLNNYDQLKRRIVTIWELLTNKRKQRRFINILTKPFKK